MIKTFRITKLTLILIGILTLNSCWNNPSEHDLITGNYYVGWNDMVSNRAIVYKYDSNSYEGILSSYVYAVGHNTDFIIAKQKYPFSDDLSDTKYFIIDLNKRLGRDKDAIYGPMNKMEFDKKSKQLNISELKFDQVYNENP
ncbi:hypothetical protein FBALC1_08468 [Flavobacteriales bacterium ALC-1]|nr:hypothetical protein FBALC1_08468 [Flavobacteriales bacterium ALC-1]